MQYSDTKEVSFYDEDGIKTKYFTEAGVRFTPSLKMKVSKEVAPKAVKMTVFNEWNNSDELLRCSFRNGCVAVDYELMNGKWVEVKRTSWTN